MDNSLSFAIGLQLGQPVVSNGLLLTKIHHAAFDAYLMGVDPDYLFTSPTGYWISTTARSSNSASRGIAGTLINRPRRT